jgi:hypothetical protein
MTDYIHLDDAKRDVFERALVMMGEFYQVFGRSLTPHFVAEIQAARALDLDLYATPNHPSCDAVSRSGERYEIKYRSAQNVDLKSFDFDYLVLVELDDAYQLTGLWRMTADQAREIFVSRPKFLKYQTTVAKFKQIAERVR